MSEFGYVVGRFLRPVRSADGGLAGQSGEVLTRLSRVEPLLSGEGSPASFMRSAERLSLDDQGNIGVCDKQGAFLPGAWLAVGRHMVTMKFTGDTPSRTFPIDVTAEHTEENPLDLTLAAPVDLPPQAIEVVRVEDRERAEQAATEAKAARDDAVIAAARSEDAAASVEDIGEQVEQAQAYVNQATTAASQAQISASEASGHASDAAQSSTIAQEAADQVEGVAEDAAAANSSAIASRDSADAAESAATAAISARDVAQNHASSAEDFAQQAEEHEGQAKTWADSIEGSVDSASGFASSAQMSMTEALAAALRAEQAAEDVESGSFEVDTSAGTRLTVGGVTVFYDSGWRDMRQFIPQATLDRLTGFTWNRSLTAKRTLDRVYWMVTAVGIPSGSSLIGQNRSNIVQLLQDVPLSFQQSVVGYQDDVIASMRTARNFSLLFTNMNSPIRYAIRGDTGQWAQGDSWGIEISYPTTHALPTSLPGLPL